MKLANHPNVISTPHIGASTLEAQVRCGQDIAEKIVKFVKFGVIDGAVS